MLGAFVMVLVAAIARSLSDEERDRVLAVAWERYILMEGRLQWLGPEELVRLDAYQSAGLLPPGWQIWDTDKGPIALPPGWEPTGKMSFDKVVEPKIVDASSERFFMRVNDVRLDLPFRRAVMRYRFDEDYIPFDHRVGRSLLIRGVPKETYHQRIWMRFMSDPPDPGWAHLRLEDELDRNTPYDIANFGIRQLADEQGRIPVWRAGIFWEVPTASDPAYPFVERMARHGVIVATHKGRPLGLQIEEYLDEQGHVTIGDVVGNALSIGFTLLWFWERDFREHWVIVHPIPDLDVWFGPSVDDLEEKNERARSMLHAKKIPSLHGGD